MGARPRVAGLGILGQVESEPLVALWHCKKAAPPPHCATPHPLSFCCECHFLLLCSQPSGDTELVASMEQALPLQVGSWSQPGLRMELFWFYLLLCFTAQAGPVL